MRSGTAIPTFWDEAGPTLAIGVLGAILAASLFYSPIPLILLVGIPASFYFISRPYELLLLMVFLIPFNFVFKIGPIPLAAELLKVFAWIPFVFYLGARHCPFKTSRYNWYFAALMVLLFVGLLRSRDVPYAATQTMRFAFNIGLYYLVLNLVDSREKVLRIFRILVVSTFLVACYGFYQFAIQDYGALFWIVNPRIETTLAHGREAFWPWRDRITSVLTSEMELGHYFNLCLPVGVALWLTEGRKLLGSRWLLMTVAMLAGLVLTFTFASWLALAVTAGLFMLVVDKKQRWKMVLAGALLLLVAIPLIGFGPLRPFMLEKVLGSGVGSLAWDVLGRLDAWLFALQMWWPHPLVGLGVGNFEILQFDHDLIHNEWSPSGGTPHEAYLYILVQYGLIGLCAVLMVMLASIRSNLRLITHPEFGLIALALAFALTTNVLEWFADDSPFFGPHTSYLVWLFLGLGEAIRNLAVKEVREVAAA